MSLALEPVTLEDAEALVALRIAAMRPSLEAAGRFDPERARHRFLSSFEPLHTRWIRVRDARVGFVVVKPQADHWLLDHLYVHPDHQGRGWGSQVLKQVIGEAETHRVAVRLGALKGSPSNAFYRAHGFVPIGETEWDNLYERVSSSSQR